jgi:hypothetical protein
MSTVTIRATGLKKTISKLDKLCKKYSNLEAKMQTLLSRLGDEGVSVASYYFSRAIYDGTNDVTVHYELTQNQLLIVAEGHAVAFIEFGTGVYNPAYESPEMASRVGAVGRGEYGKGYGKRRAWVYRGDPGTEGQILKNGAVLTHGNPPASAMYTTTKDVHRKILEIAREVFKA